MGSKYDIKPTFTRFFDLFVKNTTCESHENTTVSVAIFALQCVSDVINESGMCGKKYETRHEPVFFCCPLVKSEPTFETRARAHTHTHTHTFNKLFVGALFGTSCDKAD